MIDPLQIVYAEPVHLYSDNTTLNRLLVSHSVLHIEKCIVSGCWKNTGESETAMYNALFAWGYLMNPNGSITPGTIELAGP